MEVKAFFDAPTFTLTFVVWDESSKDAVVIDSVLNYNPLSSQTSTESLDELSDYVRENGLEVHYALETHAHADHLSGAQLLKKRFNAKTAIGEHITAVQEVFKGVFDLGDGLATDGSQFDKLIAHGETLQAGSLEVKAIGTPGHTPACLTFQIGDALFTGDALFMHDYGTGRCDFPSGRARIGLPATAFSRSRLHARRPRPRLGDHDREVEGRKPASAPGDGPRGVREPTGSP